MIGTPRILVLSLLFATLIGCGTKLPVLSEPTKGELSEKELGELSFFVSSEITFRSIRELESFNDEGPFKRDKRRTLSLEPKSPGKAVSAGDKWITVDFGQGIVLTFRQNPQDGMYTTPGWGTITIEGERYDIMVGVLSGEEVRLLYDHIKN